jgi:hypothetical protein
MSLVSKVKKRSVAKYKSWFHSFAQGSKISFLQESLRQAQVTNDYLMALLIQGRAPHQNPLTTFGKKYFSQSDEDGILLEILRRIGIESGTCVEIGCGDGLENNTLILLAQGWKSVWIDAAPLAIDPECNPKNLAHIQAFVNRENASELVQRGLTKLEASEFEVLSIDVDGNDGYLAEAILSRGARPSVLIMETNEVIPPPIDFCQPYSPEYVWDKTKNSGWSLQSLAKLLEQFGYSCLGCNLQTGVNAFFVRNDFRQFFPEVPTSLSALYVGRSIHPYKYKDHRTSVDPGLISAIVRNAGPK